MVENRELQFNETFVARIHRLRNERGWTAEQMAIALGVPADRYRKYEYRTPLPHYLIEQFATIVGRDIEYLLTGKTMRRPAPPPPAGAPVGQVEKIGQKRA